jgi:hypothetical protein
MCSLRSKLLPPETGKAGSDLSGSLFPFIETADSATLKTVLARSGSLSPKILLALAVANLLSRTVTPQRLCACGCGAFVTGKARCASPACRKRLERERKRGALTCGKCGRPLDEHVGQWQDCPAKPPKQFNLVMQDEMPFKVKTAGVVNDSGFYKNDSAGYGFKFPAATVTVHGSTVYQNPPPPDQTKFVPVAQADANQQLLNLQATLKVAKGHWPADLLKTLRGKISELKKLIKNS